MEAEAEAKAADTRIKHLTKQFAEKKKALTAKEKDGSQMQAKLDAEMAMVEECKQKLTELDFDSAGAAALETQLQEKRVEVQQMQDRVDELNSQLQAVKFDFRDPERNFDRDRVKGVVAKLVRVQDPKVTTALEVAAGGKLYQIVVDTEQTAKALLSNGQLRNRVTIIPLNKVSQRGIPPSAIAAANKLVGSKAKPAIELVGYNKELEAAMQYVFGGSFVCQDTGSAKKLAFTKEVSTRCVTLDGDDFNPSGTLTGGSRSKTASGRVLQMMDAIAEHASIVVYKLMRLYPVVLLLQCFHSSICWQKLKRFSQKGRQSSRHWRSS
jgi:structural maintenance of chromosome 2